MNLLMLALAAFAPVAFAEVQLYDTGPSEETSYVRFVNATDHAISVVSAKGSIELSDKAAARSSKFFPVKSGVKLSATIQSGAQKVGSEVTGKPWEYITIAILPKGGKQMTTRLVRETPDDFNAMRASLSLVNLDARCSAAMMQGGAKSATILDQVHPLSAQRRLINPVKLLASVSCDAETAKLPVDLGQLQAGKRYSVFLMTVNKSRQAFFVRDGN
ncbi:MAG: hypothetical protein AUJ88_09710 [Gallionellaceae bacterium CG1_02_56_997]|nr:MAG: hypothetical protein AUJ88_09710 [Gallionellaceae bacterium CG1_02_56_997]